MLPVKSSDQVRTRRHVKSYRAGATSTGRPGWFLELGRLYTEEVALSCRKMHWRRRWQQAEAARGGRE